jgi:cyclophilin family peptidyl-prolyl cis-trans isomerase
MRYDVAPLVFLLPGLLTAGALAQPPETPRNEANAAQETAPAGAQDFVEIHKNWTATEKQLNNLRKNYNDAFTSSERQQILNEYRQVVKQAQEILPRLREAAVAAYRAAPNANPDVSSTILGLAAQDLRQDRLQSALDLAQMLADQQSDQQGLDSVLGLIHYHLDHFEQAEQRLTAAKQNGTLSPEGESFLEDAAKARQLWAEEVALRDAEQSADDLPRVRLTTSKGVLVLELYENEAPETVGNFISLVESGYYQGSPFHRVLANFMAQGGSKTADGGGDPGYLIYCECTKPEHRKHFRGTLSMAKRSDPNTGSSQFFITFRRTAHLDGKHTVFGRVLEGLDVLPEIQRRNPAESGQPEPDLIMKAEVLRKRQHEYVPHKVAKEE